MKKYIIDGLKWYWIRFKLTKVWKLWTFSILMFIFLGISRGYFNVWFYLGCFFGLYPLLFFIISFIYAWILNPIRALFPNSRFTKKVINKLDRFLMTVDTIK